MRMYYLIDLREKNNRNPYITFWRPNDAGYCYPIPWAGEYTEERIIEGDDYYTRRRWQVRTGADTGIWESIAVRTDLIKPFCIEPAYGMIDGNIGPVIANTGKIRTALRRLRFILPKERIAA